MNITFGESFKYAVTDAATYQDIINNYLLDSNLEVNYIAELHSHP